RRDGGERAGLRGARRIGPRSRSVRQSSAEAHPRPGRGRTPAAFGQEGVGMRCGERCGRVLVVALAVLASAGSPRAESLMDLYFKARENDPVFRQAEYQLRIADEIIKEARAGLLPVVDGTAERSRTYQDVSRSQSVLFQEGKRDFDTTNY